MKKYRSNTVSMDRNIIIMGFLALGIFIMAGCEPDPKEAPEQHLVTVSFTTRSLSGSLLKSASPEEIAISKIILFGVDDQGAVVQRFPKLVNPSSLSDITLSIVGDVQSLYAIANPTTNLEWTTPSTLADLMDMTVDLSSAPQSPFVMSGVGEVYGDNVNLELIRTVAKISFTGINDFQIISVTVTNSTSMGYVFGREGLSIPVSGKVSYPNINLESDPSIYIGESSLLDPVQFLVEGRLQGNPASCTISLTKGGQNIDIIRNTCYQVNVGVEFED